MDHVAQIILEYEPAYPDTNPAGTKVLEMRVCFSHNPGRGELVGIVEDCYTPGDVFAFISTERSGMVSIVLMLK